MIKPWRATCMQVYSHYVHRAKNREEAHTIINKSLDRWEELAMAAARMGGPERQLVLFPEFALTGFPLSETAAEWIEKACTEIPGENTERLQATAQRLGIYIGANAYERDPTWPGRYFNCSFLIDPSGDVILKYRRINTVHTSSPHDFLEQYLDRHGIEGTFPVADTELGKIAMMPCGEIMYPEAARMFMFRGAEVLLHPTSDYGASDRYGWESAKVARASENMMYLVSTNAGGTTGAPLPENSNMGHSKIIDYDGQRIAEAAGPGESLIATALIDVEGLRRARMNPGSLNRILRQRVEIYRPIYNEASMYPVNLFADEAMDSKARIMAAQKDAVEKLVAKGVITPPSS